jgi:hypothetical protein
MSIDTIPADYITQLYDQGKQKKARAALEFFFLRSADGMSPQTSGRSFGA